MAARPPSRSRCSSTARARCSPGEGFVRLILPLTDDLDRVSEELFALKTNGGDEYCGWVIRDAVNRLEWSGSREVYKAIFIAGNEPFTQGSVDFHGSCRAAIERGILVNTIFCGASAEGRQTGWKDGAVLADGRYMSIDQNQKVVEIPAPQDAEIARLGVELNKTYLPYGKMGAGRAGPAISPGRQRRRCVAKRAGEPLGLQGERVLLQRRLGPCRRDQERQVQARGTQGRRPSRRHAQARQAGRKAKVAEAAKQREEIQAQIGKLNKEREAYLAAERKKRPAERADPGSGDRARRSGTRPRSKTSSSSRLMDSKRILVVEDDAAIRRGLVDALSFAGYATLEASEGAAGLAAALESDCDLLLLDLVLPGRDGLAVLRELRALRRRCR